MGWHTCWSPAKQPLAAQPACAITFSHSQGLGPAVLGAARQWQGHAQPLEQACIEAMQFFLAADQPHLRVWGAQRFDPTAAAAEHWDPFGSYLFMLPM